MWIVLEQMYGPKKKDIYSLHQRKKLVSDYYRVLKVKWEDSDYCTDKKWKCFEDQDIYWNRE